MKTKQLLLSTVAAAFLAAPVAGALAQGKTGIVKIGVNETLSGKFVGVGLPPTTAIRLAVHEVNEKGFKVGDTTYKFEPIILDNRSEGSVMVANATRLIEDDKVKVIFGPTLVTAMIGTALWGLGCSLGFPTGMSAAADDPRFAAGRVSAVATIGYTAFLAGPALVGLLGDHVGVLRALTLTACLLGVGLVVAGATAPLEVTATTSDDH